MNDTFLLSDGLIVTLVAILVVFVILASIWGLMELVHKVTKGMTDSKQPASSLEKFQEPQFEIDKKREMVAALTALIRAHEEKPAKKYEIIEIKRIK